eukprot:scaffold558697_cov29-Prasinocladus_malaysianus.AAC.1
MPLLLLILTQFSFLSSPKGREDVGWDGNIPVACLDALVSHSHKPSGQTSCCMWMPRYHKHTATVPDCRVTAPPLTVRCQRP